MTETETPTIIPVLTAPYDWRPGCNYYGYNSKWCGKPAVYLNGNLDIVGDTVEEMAADIAEKMDGWRPFANAFLCKRHLGTIRSSESRRAYSRWNSERSTAYTEAWPTTFLDAYYSVVTERARISRAEYEKAEAERQTQREERIADLIKQYDTEAEGYVAPAKPTFVVVEDARYSDGKNVKVVKVGESGDYDREVITFEVDRCRVHSYSVPQPASIRVSMGYGSETALLPLCMTEVAVAAARAQAYLTAYQKEFVAALKAGKEVE